MHTYIHTCIRAYIHTYMHTYLLGTVIANFDVECILRAKTLAHKLVDKVVAMQDEGTLLFIPPNACVSRVPEIHQDKHEAALTFDSSGNIRMGKKAEELKCETSPTIRQGLLALWFWKSGRRS